MTEVQIEKKLFPFTRYLILGPLLLIMVSIWILLWGRLSIFLWLSLGLGCGLSVSIRYEIRCLARQTEKIKSDLPEIIDLVNRENGDILFKQAAPVPVIHAVRLYELNQRKAALLISAALITQILTALFLLLTGLVTMPVLALLSSILLLSWYVGLIFWFMRKVLLSDYIPPLKKNQRK